MKDNSQEHHKKLPWFPFYPKDWLSSTDIELMNAAEEGAYIRLLCHEWESVDCSLPDDDRQLAVLSRLGSKWKTSSSRIRGKFKSSKGRLVNEKLAELWVKAVEKSKKAASASAVRWQCERIPNAYANGMPRASESDVVFSSEVKATVLQTASCGSEFPETLAEIRKVDPGVDETFVRSLANRVGHMLLSSKTFPQHRLETATTDHWIAKACKESFSTGPPNHRPGLLLSRVPNILISWGVEKET